MPLGMIWGLVVRYLEGQYAIGVDATSRRRLAPYYKFVRTADDALRTIRR